MMLPHLSLHACEHVNMWQLSCNHMIMHVGVFQEDPWEALEVALHRPAQPIDIGTVNGRVRTIAHLHLVQPVSHDDL